jgi:hypothetical protein
MAEQWHLTGQVLVACNCDWGCPCNFNARPSKGKCEGGWTWHVDTGTYGDVTLDGLNFSVYVNWPGAIHEGNGEAVILIDERANERQRSAIETLIGGSLIERRAVSTRRSRRPAGAFGTFVRGGHAPNLPAA